MPTQEMTNKEIVEVLQSRGVEVNPNASKAVLLAQLKDSELPIPTEVHSPKSSNDTQAILDAIGGLTSVVKGLEKRVSTMETGGKDAFKDEMKESDVLKASELKKNLDPRIVQIVEDNLGIDFGVEIEGYKDKPGLLFTILVPQRLSPVETTDRPVRNQVTGEYTKTKRVLNGSEIEETVMEVYWPGDRRSRAIGSTQSYDVVVDHCNKVRANIVSYYEKLKKPIPEFKTRN